MPKTDPLANFPPEMMRNRILNTKQAAAFLGFSVVHFMRLVRAGTLPQPIKLGGRNLGWRLGTLIDFVNSKS